MSARKLTIKAIEEVAIDKIKPHPKNYRQHPEDQLSHIIESIEKNGVYRNIVVAKEGTILAGHGVYLAMVKMEFKTVPIVRLPIEPNSAKAMKILVGDNEISHLGEIDDRTLSEVLKDIKVEDLDGLLGTGYDEAMLANLLLVTRPESEIKDINEAAEWVGMPELGGVDNPYKVVVNIETEFLRQKFLKLIGINTISKRSGKTSSVNWPPRDRDDTKAIRFVEEEDFTERDDGTEE